MPTYPIPLVTGTSQASPGTLPWSNPGNVLADNAAYAQATGVGTTRPLRAVNAADTHVPSVVLDELRVTKRGHGVLHTPDMVQVDYVPDAANNYGSTATVAAYRDGFVYAGGGNNRMVVFDVSDPTDLVVADIVDLAGIGFWNQLIFYGNTAFMSNVDEIVSLDVSDPYNVSVIQILTSATQIDDVRGMAISPDGQVLYIANEDDFSIASIDVSNPSNMGIMNVLVSSPNFTLVRDLTISEDGNTLFARSNPSTNARVVAINCSNPNNLSVISGLTISGSTSADANIKCKGNTVYTIHSNTILVSINASNPSAMSISDTLELPGVNGANKTLAIEDDYLVTLGHGFHLVNISNPNDLVLLDHYIPPLRASDPGAYSWSLAGHWPIFSLHDGYIFATWNHFQTVTTIELISVQTHEHTSVVDSSVRLVVGGSAVGPNKAVGSEWNGIDQEYVWTEAELETLGLTPTQVNAGNFGVQVQATLDGVARVEYLDGIEIDGTPLTEIETSGFGTLDSETVFGLGITIETVGFGELESGTDLTIVPVTYVESSGVGFLYPDVVLEVGEYISLFSRGMGSLTADVHVRNMVTHIEFESLGTLEAEVQVQFALLLRTAGYGEMIAGTSAIQRLLISVLGSGILHSGVVIRQENITNPTPRHLYQFTNYDESLVIGFPVEASAYEWVSNQTLVQSYISTVGSDYGIESNTPQKGVASEVIRFYMTSDGALNLNQALRSLRGNAFRIGRGKLWLRAIEGRRWAEARVDSIPEIRLNRSPHILPIVLEFTRLTDWYDEYPIGNDSLSQVGGIVQTTIDNPGTSRSAGTFSFSGSFVNPTLRILSDSGYEDEITVNVSASGILTIDTGKLTAHLDGVNISHLIDTPENQMGFPMLGKGENTVTWLADSGTFIAGYSFYPAYH